MVGLILYWAITASSHGSEKPSEHAAAPAAHAPAHAAPVVTSKSSAKAPPPVIITSPEVLDPQKVIMWLNSSIWSLLALNFIAFILFVSTLLLPQIKKTSQIFRKFLLDLSERNAKAKTEAAQNAKEKKESKDALAASKAAVASATKAALDANAATNIAGKVVTGLENLPPPPPMDVGTDSTLPPAAPFADQPTNVGGAATVTPSPTEQTPEQVAEASTAASIETVPGSQIPVGPGMPQMNAADLVADTARADEISRMIANAEATVIATPAEEKPTPSPDLAATPSLDIAATPSQAPVTPSPILEEMPVLDKTEIIVKPPELADVPAPVAAIPDVPLTPSLDIAATPSLDIAATPSQDPEALSPELKPFGTAASFDQVLQEVLNAPNEHTEEIPIFDTSFIDQALKEGDPRV